MRVVDFESDFNKDNEGIKKTILGAATELKNESQSKSTGAILATSEQKVPDFEPIQSEQDIQIETTEVNDIDLNTINTTDISISTQKEEHHEENYDDLSYEDFDINNI
jgi:hypothetical protein